MNELDITIGNKTSTLKSQSKKITFYNFFFQKKKQNLYVWRDKLTIFFFKWINKFYFWVKKQGESRNKIWENTERRRTSYLVTETNQQREFCCDLREQVGVDGVVVDGVEDVVEGGACDSPWKVVDSLPNSNSNSSQPHHLFQPFFSLEEKNEATMCVWLATWKREEKKGKAKWRKKVWCLVAVWVTGFGFFAVKGNWWMELNIYTERERDRESKIVDGWYRVNYDLGQSDKLAQSSLKWLS